MSPPIDKIFVYNSVSPSEPEYVAAHLDEYKQQGARVLYTAQIPAAQQPALDDFYRDVPGAEARLRQAMMTESSSHVTDATLDLVKRAKAAGIQVYGIEHPVTGDARPHQAAQTIKEVTRLYGPEAGIIVMVDSDYIGSYRKDGRIQDYLPPAEIVVLSTERNRANGQRTLEDGMRLEIIPESPRAMQPVEMSGEAYLRNVAFSERDATIYDRVTEAMRGTHGGPNSPLTLKAEQSEAFRNLVDILAKPTDATQVSGTATLQALEDLKTADPGIRAACDAAIGNVQSYHQIHGAPLDAPYKAPNMLPTTPSVTDGAAQLIKRF